MRDGVRAHERDARRAARSGPASRPCAASASAAGHDVVADPAVALAAERGADLRQHGQVAGAERAELARERRDARAQRAQQRVEQALADARAAGADLVRAHRHRRAHDLDRQRRAAAARVQRSSRHWWSPGSSSRLTATSAASPTPVVTP